MKNYFHKQIRFSLLFCAVLFTLSLNVQIRAQDKKPFKLKEIVEKLKKNSGAENQQNIIKEIFKRGADVELNAKNEKLLRDVGANDLLIKFINEIKERERLYKLYLDNYDKNVDKKRIAIKAGKDYLEKFENSANFQYDPLIPYLKENLPILEQQIKEIEKAIKQTIDDFPCQCISDYQHHVENFNYAVKRRDWKTTFSTGEEILKLKPDFLDVAIVLASVGYDQAFELKEKSKFNKQTVYYSQLAIELIEKGTESQNYGASWGDDKNQKYQYKNKLAALAYMNYFIGYVKYFGQDKKDEAIPYFVKVTTYKSKLEKGPLIYIALGNWYFEKANKAKSENDSDKNTLQKSLAERALDAYARAYNLAVLAGEKLSEETRNRLITVYEFLYGRSPTHAELEKTTNAVKGKPLPEPF